MVERAKRPLRHPARQGASRLRPAGRKGQAGPQRRGWRLTPKQGAEVFRTGLRRIKDAARNIGGVEVINVCLRKADVKAYERVSLDRLLNRINTSVAAEGRHAFLIFDEG